MFDSARYETTDAGRRCGGPVHPRRAEPTAPNDVLVVSNRQPYRHEYADDGDEIRISRPTGGLTAALDRALRGTDAAWIAWGDGDADPDVVDTKTRITVRRWAEAMLDGTTGGDRR